MRLSVTCADLRRIEATAAFASTAFDRRWMLTKSEPAWKWSWRRLGRVYLGTTWHYRCLFCEGWYTIPHTLPLEKRPSNEEMDSRHWQACPTRAYAEAITA